MTIKLDFSYDFVLECDVSHVGSDLRVRAVCDECAEDPIVNSETVWPMLVRDSHDDLGGLYECPPGSGVAISTPFNGAALSSCRTPDELLVHDQHAFARIFGFTIPDMIQSMIDAGWDMTPGSYCRNAAALREALMDAYSDLDDSDKLDILEAIYKLLGIPCLRTTIHGYVQSAWAELFIVAVPELQRKFWGEEVREPDQIEADMRAQADLYAAWAYGDCYGYVVERAVRQTDQDEDDEPEWEEVEEGSCWGYYGRDHDESGLAEGAVETIMHFLMHNSLATKEKTDA